MLSLAQLLILFDHVLLAILFLIALFCIISAVTTSIFTSAATLKSPRDRGRGIINDELNDIDDDDIKVIERTDTCYSVKNGTSVLFESDLNNVV